MKKKIVGIFVSMLFLASVISSASNIQIGLLEEKQGYANDLRLHEMSAIDSPPSEEWNKTFGGTEADMGYAVQQTSDGGYIIVGHSFSGGGPDVWLIKTDYYGNEEWNKKVEGGYGRSVQQTSDGGYIITGYQGADLLLIKTGSTGNKEWSKTYGGSSWDEGNSVQQTKDGGYIVTGYQWVYGSVQEVYLLKTDADGNKQWDKTFGGGNIDIGYSVQQTTDGGYIITGYTWSYGPGYLNVWLIKTDGNGNKQWDKTFGGPYSQIGYSVRQTTDGGYIITGFTDYHQATNYDVWLIKTDASGNQEWEKTFGGAEEDQGRSVWQTADDGYIITGETESFGAGDKDVWLIKTDADGDEEWNQTFGGADEDIGMAVQQTIDRGYIIAGKTRSYGAGNVDFWLIKIGGSYTLITTFMLGLISNLNAPGLFYTFDANIVLYMQFNPFLISIYSSNEQIIVSNQYFGVLSQSFICGFFKVVV